MIKVGYSRQCFPINEDIPWFTYRILTTFHSGSGERGVHYEMDMGYTPNGKIKRKKVGGMVNLNGGNVPIVMDYE